MNDRAQLLATSYAAHGVELPALSVQRMEGDTPVFSFRVDAREAVATWTKLRPLTDETGHYPVVVVDDGLIEEAAEVNAPATESLAAATEVDPRAWLAERRQSDPESYDEVELGAWEDVAPQSEFTVPTDVMTGEPAKNAVIALVPTTRAWEALAYFRYGGWNECPPTEAHIALQRSWFERYGAELVCLSGDVVEMRVTRPPGTREAALELAHEQFLYSGGDLVFQGYETMRRLAASLVGATTWFFWWD